MVVERLWANPSTRGPKLSRSTGPVDAAVRRLWVVLDSELDHARDVVVGQMAASRSAVSMPADTPAPVRYRPSSTQRWGT